MVIGENHTNQSRSNLPKNLNDKGPLNMNRRYIDSNRVSYQFHSKTNQTTFDTVSPAIPIAVRPLLTEISH